MPPTVFPLIVTFPLPTPSVIPVTSGLRSRLVNRAALIGSKLTCSGSPHRRGVVVRCVRLDPKTPVAHKATTASTMPKRAEPNGTVDPPDRRSRALRTPITAVGGAPRDTSCATTVEGRERAARPSALWARAPRSAGQTPSNSTIITVANAPSASTKVSNANPVESSASRASPRGAMGDKATARITAPTAPTTPTTSVRAMPRATSCRFDIPTADRAGWSSLSTSLCRASAWPTTARPTSAASAARIHHPTAWGWIDASIVAATPSSLE